jgi:hypothetical protein
MDRRLGLTGPLITVVGEPPGFDQLKVEKARPGEREAYYFQAGRFYQARGKASKFYCKEVDDGDAKIYLVESFRDGSLVQALFTQRLIHANTTGYEEITDKDEIKRLTHMLRRLK